MDMFDCTQVLHDNLESDPEDTNTKVRREDQPIAFLSLVSAHDLPVKKYPLYIGKNTIGRADSCKVCISNQTLSKEHAFIEIDRKGETFELVDTGSANRTRKGKITLKPNVRYNIEDGTVVTFADLEFQFVISPKEEGTDNDSDTCSESMFADDLLESDSSPDKRNLRLSSTSLMSNDQSTLDKCLVPVSPTPEKKRLFPSPASHHAFPMEGPSKNNGPLAIPETPTRDLLCMPLHSDMKSSLKARSPSCRDKMSSMSNDSMRSHSNSPSNKNHSNTSDLNKTRLDNSMDLYEAETQPCEDLEATQLYVPSQVDDKKPDKEAKDESIYEAATQLYEEPEKEGDLFAFQKPHDHKQKNMDDQDNIATQPYVENPDDFPAFKKSKEERGKKGLFHPMFTPSASESSDADVTDNERNRRMFQKTLDRRYLADAVTSPLHLGREGNQGKPSSKENKNKEQQASETEAAKKRDERRDDMKTNLPANGKITPRADKKTEESQNGNQVGSEKESPIDIRKEESQTPPKGKYSRRKKTPSSTASQSLSELPTQILDQNESSPEVKANHSLSLRKKSSKQVEIVDLKPSESTGFARETSQRRRRTNNSQASEDSTEIMSPVFGTRRSSRRQTSGKLEKAFPKSSSPDATTEEDDEPLIKLVQEQNRENKNKNKEKENISFRTIDENKSSEVQSTNLEDSNSENKSKSSGRKGRTHPATEATPKTPEDGKRKRGSSNATVQGSDETIVHRNRRRRKSSNNKEDMKTIDSANSDCKMTTPVKQEKTDDTIENSELKVDPLVLVVNKSALGSSTPYTIQRGRKSRKETVKANDMNTSIVENSTDQNSTDEAFITSRRKAKTSKRKGKTTAKDDESDVEKNQSNVTDENENVKKSESKTAKGRPSSRWKKKKETSTIETPTESTQTKNSSAEETAEKIIKGNKKKTPTYKKKAKEITNDTSTDAEEKPLEETKKKKSPPVKEDIPSSETKKKRRASKRSEAEMLAACKPIEKSSEAIKRDTLDALKTATPTVTTGRRSHKRKNYAEDGNSDGQEINETTSQKKKTMSLRQYRRKNKGDFDTSSDGIKSESNEDTVSAEREKKISKDASSDSDSLSDGEDDDFMKRRSKSTPKPRGRPVARGRKRAAPKSNSKKDGKSENEEKESRLENSFKTPKKTPKSQQNKKAATEASAEPKTPIKKKKNSASTTTWSIKANQEKTIDPEMFKQRCNIEHPVVAFTGVSDEQAEKIIKELGGKMSDNIMTCTHLVTDKVRRTFKFLCQVARGMPIVTLDWVHRSKKAGKFIDASAFIVSDSASEKQFGFQLQRSLEIASNQPLLNGFSIHVTPGVKPEPSQMKMIIECAGGEYLTRMPTLNLPDRKTTVVSCTEDLRNCSRAMAGSVPVVSAEFILTGVLRQSDDIESYCLIT